MDQQEKYIYNTFPKYLVLGILSSQNNIKI